MPEHTPGPWEWNIEEDDGHGVLQRPCNASGERHEGLEHTARECGGTMILSCDSPVAPMEDDYDGRPSPPDARLIAAAPELLEACKLARQMATRWLRAYNKTLPPWYDPSDDDANFAVIDAAIAKAEP